MLDKVYNFISKYNMLESGDTVVCGLSGGADSVALLLVLCELRERLNISIEAIHVNHCLRGAESDRDESFCRDLCKKKNIVFNSVSCDVSGFSASKGISVEEAARELRYSAFREYSQGKKLATAHNANDVLETTILNLVRGTGLKGLAGIPAVRDNIIRPLLPVTRAEIESFLKNHVQEHITDSTNLSDDYTRNKIRHKVIPLLNELNGSLIETSVKSLETLRDENAFIDNYANKAFNKCFANNTLTELSSYEPVIRKRCIARLLSANALPYSHKRLEEADTILINGGKINISDNFYLIGEKGSIKLKKIVPKDTECISKPLIIGENCIFPDKVLICELIQCDNLKKNDSFNKMSTFSLLDYDKIRGRAIVRNRKFGDKIKLRNKNFTSSVKKLINEKIPSDMRSTLYFIEDEEGTIYAEGLGIADRTATDEHTKNFLKITVKRV